VLILPLPFAQLLRCIADLLDLAAGQRRRVSQYPARPCPVCAHVECPGFFVPVSERDWNKVKGHKWHEASDIKLSRW